MKNRLILLRAAGMLPVVSAVLQSPQTVQVASCVGSPKGNLTNPYQCDEQRLADCGNSYTYTSYGAALQCGKLGVNCLVVDWCMETTSTTTTTVAPGCGPYETCGPGDCGAGYSYIAQKKACSTGGMCSYADGMGFGGDMNQCTKSLGSNMACISPPQFVEAPCSGGGTRYRCPDTPRVKHDYSPYPKLCIEKPNCPSEGSKDRNCKGQFLLKAVTQTERSGQTCKQVCNKDYKCLGWTEQPSGDCSLWKDEFTMLLTKCVAEAGFKSNLRYCD